MPIMKASRLLPVLIVLTALATAVINQQAGKSVYLQQHQQLGQAISQQLALSARPWLLAEDRLGLQALLSGLVTNSQLQYVAIYAADNKLIAAAGEPARGNTFQTYSANISLQSRLFGQAKVWLKPVQHVDKRWLILLSFIPALLVSAACFIWLRNNIDRPLYNIKQQLNLLVASDQDSSAAQAESQLKQFMQRWQSNAFWRAKVAEYQRKNPPRATTMLVLVLHDEEHWHGHADHGRVQQSKAHYQQLLALASLHFGGGLPEAYSPLTACFSHDNDNQVNSLRAAYLLIQLNQYLYRLLVANNRPAFQVSVGIAQPQNNSFRDAHSLYSYTLNEALSLGRYGQSNEVLFNGFVAAATKQQQHSALVNNELNNTSFHVLQLMPDTDELNQTAAKLWADLGLEIAQD